MMLSTYEAFRAHAASPGEVCGLIVRNGEGEVYRPCVNTSEQPDAFRLREEDWIRAEEMGEVIAVCHSHQGSPEPGKSDLERVNEHGIPWFIVGTGGELQRVDPVMLPLEGREFVYGWTDCYSLVRDWFLVMQGVRLPDFPREPKFWERKASPYLDNYTRCGFREVSLAEIQAGDVVLMRILAEVPNHAAIYVGEGRILHHLWGKLSACDLYNGSYQRVTTHVLRHTR